jgi:ubiquinone/menaquinone biosynthesis C-methylase UbiE
MKSDEYVLGVNDEEVVRLGIQHRVWRTYMLDGWKNAGLQTGQKVLDVGAGPGFATVDLAEIVGPTGSVDAFELSDRFIEMGTQRVKNQGLTNVTYTKGNLLEDELPGKDYDLAWCRWVFAFLSDPKLVAKKVAQSLKPGGRFVIHEYLQYDTWRLIPEKTAIQNFVQVVMKQWLNAGGEYDVARVLPQILMDAGLEVVHTRPMMFQMRPADYAWNWPAKFIRNQTPALVEQGLLSQDKCDVILSELEEAESDPKSLMISPLVLEIIARKN